MRRLLCLLLLVLALPATAAGLLESRPSSTLGSINNSADFLPVREAFQLSLVESTPQSIKLRFVATEGYYLYRHRFQFRADPAEVVVGPAQLPKGEQKHDEYFGDVEVYHGILDVELPRSDQRAFTLAVTYQGCADKGLCYPPETERLTIEGSGGGTTSWSWRALALFFLAGLGLTFTPCVLPMAACFALLGALMGMFGAQLNLQARLQSAWVLVPFAMFFAVFALAMFGVFELKLPQAISSRLDRIAGRTEGGSLWGAAVLGVVSSLLVSPCVSAPLAGALLYISASGDALGGGLKLFMLGLGMGAPLLLVATGGAAWLPKSGPWLVYVKNAIGVLLLGLAIGLVSRVLPGQITLLLIGLLAGGVGLFMGALEFVYKPPRKRLGQLLGMFLLFYALACWFGAFSGQTDPFNPIGQPRIIAGTEQPQNTSAWQTISTPADLDRVLAEAKSTNTPLLLDWYADWCISCKVIEREVLNDATVIERLKGYRLVRFDITASNAEQRALLDRYKLFGPPALMFFGKDGVERADVRVIGEISATDFAERVAKANDRI